jgi:predicted GTPase
VNNQDYCIKRIGILKYVILANTINEEKNMKKAIIMGAAGRDFHNFNVYLRDNDSYKLIAFTATQIPDIEGRKYPPELSGKLYPSGIPIYSENRLTVLI